MKVIDYLLLFVPISIVLGYAHANSIVVFITSILAMVPLAYRIGDATEELAKHYGGHAGTLLNATFGNSTELIIALIAIHMGLIDLVKASITGSIIGNLLFVLGMSLFFGGLKYSEQRISSPVSGMNSTMLLIAFASLMIPSVFSLMAGSLGGEQAHTLSDVVSVLVISLYILSLVFSLKTHNHIFKDVQVAAQKPRWSKLKAIMILGAATVAVAVVGEVFISQVRDVASVLGFSELFIGAFIVAVVGNVAEHISAIMFAMRNQIDLSVGITVGSSLQIALFVAPLTVLLGGMMGQPMDLVFMPFEIIAVFASVLIVNEIASDGRCNWFEGAQLITMYAIIGALFYFAR